MNELEKIKSANLTFRPDVACIMANRHPLTATRWWDRLGLNIYKKFHEAYYPEETYHASLFEIYPVNKVLRLLSMSATTQRQSVMGSEQEYSSPMSGMVDGEAEQISYSSEDHARYMYAKYLSSISGCI